MVVIMTTKSQ